MTDIPMTYIAVLYVTERTVPVCKTLLSKERADVLLRDPSPEITDKATNKTYKVIWKQTFTYNNTDQSQTFFIICQTEKVENHGS